MYTKNSPMVSLDHINFKNNVFVTLYAFEDNVYNPTPVTGELDWMDEGKLIIDTALGLVVIPLSTIDGFVQIKEEEYVLLCNSINYTLSVRTKTQIQKVIDALSEMVGLPPFEIENYKPYESAAYTEYYLNWYSASGDFMFTLNLYSGDNGIITASSRVMMTDQLWDRACDIIHKLNWSE